MYVQRKGLLQAICHLLLVLAGEGGGMRGDGKKMEDGGGIGGGLLEASLYKVGPPSSNPMPSSSGFGGGSRGLVAT